jgi:flagellin-like hook-associated protein FlgL
MDIYLSAASRSNLLSLQNTQGLMGRTQERLATGLKVNTALDDPNAFFQSRMLEGRAMDFGNLLQDMGQAVQTIKTATTALETIEDLLVTMKAKATQARTATVAAERTAYLAEYNTLIAQIEELAADSSYKGVNLLAGDSLTVEFSIDNAARDLDINTGADAADYAGGIDAATTAGGLGVNDGAGWTADAAGDTAIDADLVELQAALVEVRNQAGTFGVNLSIIEARINFTENNINILEEGSGKLILADQNEESANMLALQTRQQLGTTALSLTSQAEQGVLRLF